ncbi:MAG TPA: Cof-type HAD-IIB family hydrolase [Thermogutta sp.]|nr:Cof-type HAD-IIB family hydrolase [Thermogutta sp.]
MGYRFLALDIDGTLVSTVDAISPSVREAIARAAEAGLEVILATGRRYSRALPFSKILQIETPLVTSSGALTKIPKTHETLFRARFSDEVLRKTLMVLRELGFPAAILGDTFSHGFDYYIERPNGYRNPYFEDYLEQNSGSERIWDDFLAELPPEIFATFTVGSEAEMKWVESQLHAALPHQLTTNVLRSPRYRGFFCEIMPAGTTKWSAICQLAAQRGVTPREICAVGDDVNDISMIREAGFGVAMGNAPDEVKKAAHWVAPPQEEDGLVAVIERLLEESS